jgi:NADH-quinone oxidoreductase subunit L
MSESTILPIVAVLPLLSALVMGSLHISGSLRGERFYALVGTIVPVLSAIVSIFPIYSVLSSGRALDAHLYEWVSIGDFTIDISLRLDPLSAVMLFIVTFVGSVIHIYAVGYMRGDDGFGRFFSYFNLFLGSMLLLILASNPILMFVGWELVGLSSYLLIGYYYDSEGSIEAANKAFVLNRVGDFGLMSGIALLFVSTQTDRFSFVDIAGGLGSVDSATLALIGGLLFVGAIGKSAQIPLFVWLPDAMAGPTPVSALIHAATMVTAGVYMVARFSFLYEEIPYIGEIIAYTGGVSALLAALFASYQTDIKKILAYSTMSQLGYMFIGAGVGAYSTALFHLFTHAFFKALLFMGAGAVIILFHHRQNIFEMGGVARRRADIAIPMLVGGLAISGIPPFAGFFSKDAILVHTFASGHYLLWGIAMVGAFLTAYYIFRLYFVVFTASGDDTGEESLAEIPSTMIWTLYILAIGTVVVGFAGVPEAFGGDFVIGDLLSLPDRVVAISHTLEWTLTLMGLCVSVCGIALAYLIFVRKSIKERNGEAIYAQPLYEALYIDRLYRTVFVDGLRRVSGWCAKVVDDTLIDGAIMAVVRGYGRAGDVMAGLQNGSVGRYAIYMLTAISLASLYILNRTGN